MGSTFRIRARLLARVVAPILFATALSACSTAPDWIDPTTWIGGDSQASSDQSADAGAASDQSAASAPAGDQTAENPSSSDGKTPDIAAIPPKPAQPSTADEQKQVAESLAADRAQAHYSADALRGGTEAQAAPPPAEAAASTSGNSQGAEPGAADTSAAGASNADSQAAANPTPPPAEPSATSPGSGDESSAAAQAASASAPAPAPQSAPPPAPSQMASADTPSAAAPAAAPMAPETGAPDMQATFAPSKAPALDPSVNQFVPQQILSHYRETAATAAVPGETSSGTAARRHHHKKIKSSQRSTRNHYAQRSRLQHMAMIHLHYPSTWRSAALHRAAPKAGGYGLDPSLFAQTGPPAIAVVNFSRETTILDGKARNRIQLAAQNFAAQGGGGFMRVVGHASSPASAAPRAIRLRNNFERSEAQATAVARELIRDGVPPQKVMVEAVGDKPAGGHGAGAPIRIAEIFLQS
jgi:hypothetical protein